ncbi:hypothetical protein ABEB36_015171 [Hypothenemus hampei]|uniref:Uncharacterized protein n=1 Tax=Hypothenemus hampei TaxID=57062 RepID=A0ABD1E0N9_HYPHA
MIVHYVVVLWQVLIGVRCMEKMSMYVKKSEINDQKMSGSGYSYNNEEGKPQKYSFELDGGEDALRIIRDLGYEPFNDELSAKYPYALGYSGKNQTLQKSGGKVHKDYSFQKHGDSLNKAYNVVDAYAKGLKGNYDKQSGKSYYEQTAGKKAAAFDAAGNYNVNQATGGVSIGGSFDKKDFHDDGSKTTGYHKVYHKDDYNKQHKFYDKADRKGHFTKFGSAKENDDQAAGEFVKGAQYTDGHASNKWVANDASDKSNFDEASKGFKKAQKDEGFYQDYVKKTTNK